MMVLLVLGVVIFCSFYAYLMSEIFKDAFAPEPIVQARPITVGQWRKQAYTQESIERRETRRFQAYLDRLAADAQDMMVEALNVVSRNYSYLRELDHRALRRYANSTERYSWPKKTTIVMKVTEELRSPLLLIS